MLWNRFNVDWFAAQNLLLGLGQNLNDLFSRQQRYLGGVWSIRLLLKIVEAFGEFKPLKQQT
jgi:hypothetical protein